MCSANRVSSYVMEVFRDPRINSAGDVTESCFADIVNRNFQTMITEFQKEAIAAKVPSSIFNIFNEIHRLLTWISAGYLSRRMRL